MDQDTRLFELSKQLQEQLTRVREQFFFTEILFSLQWWLMAAAIIGAYVLLWYAIDRSRLLPILFVGLLSFCISSTVDHVGTEILWWDYPYMMFPWGPRLLSADLIIPVGYMLIYQRFRDWRTFFLSSIGLSAVYTFLFEPFAQVMKVYEMYQWKHLYSFPIYVGIGLFSKWAANTVERIGQQEGSTS
jgi:hypothetical protein